MKSHVRRLIITLLAIVVIAAWYFYKSKVQNHQSLQPTADATIRPHLEIQGVSSNLNQTHAAIAIPLGTSVPADILARYRQGLISGDEALSETSKRRYTQQQSFYGKIVDQNTNPIPGVDVIGSIDVIGDASTGVQTKIQKTQSDSDGLFEFFAEKGGPFNVTVKKDGYLMGKHGEGYQGPPGEKTTPYDRAILTMWKIHGAEPLVNSSIDSTIPHDGTPVAFDIASGKQSAAGDLRLNFTRSPSEVRRSGQGFDWSLKIEILQGGLVAENDAYPYWAPENGYNQDFSIDMSSNNVTWYSHLTQNFYIKNAHGQYGLMQANVYTALTPVRIQLNFVYNPSGSHNLEPSTEQ